ncbi:MAG: ABC transporter [Bacteroidetes bacterium]|nr:MAG: ABC transporter [Bacteroidota bacterium]
MQITLNNFIPNPLSETFSGESDVWKKNNLVLNDAFVTAIISESGKGKSSLLSSIYGLRKDYQGEISIDNKDIRTYDLVNWTYLRRVRLSMVFQSLQLFPKLTAMENIMLKNSLRNHKTMDEIQHWISLLGMQPYINQTAATLSFGQQQRIAIIRALCQPYTTILLDEPFSHLDSANAEIAWEIITEESKSKQANIIITGLKQTNFFAADKILIL